MIVGALALAAAFVVGVITLALGSGSHVLGGTDPTAQPTDGRSSAWDSPLGTIAYDTDDGSGVKGSTQSEVAGANESSGALRLPSHKVQIPLATSEAPVSVAQPVVAEPSPGGLPPRPTVPWREIQVPIVHVLPVVHECDACGFICLSFDLKCDTSATHSEWTRHTNYERESGTKTVIECLECGAQTTTESSFCSGCLKRFE